MADKAPETKQPRPVVQVAFEGRLTAFKLYTDPTRDGAPYILQPNGKRAYVTKRRDDTYMVTE